MGNSKSSSSKAKLQAEIDRLKHKIMENDVKYELLQEKYKKSENLLCLNNQSIETFVNILLPDIGKLQVETHRLNNQIVVKLQEEICRLKIEIKEYQTYV